jgi:hypothetical protein
MTRLNCPSGATPSLPIHGRPRAGTLEYHRHLMVVRIAAFATLWVVAGCAASSGSPGESPEATAQSTDVAGSLAPASLQPSPDPTAGPGPIDLPALIIEPIVADIARLAAVPVDHVTVQSAEFITFPNAGLGCPVPGMAYSQVQVDGYKIVGIALGTTYDYRGTGPGRFRLCTPQK